MLYLGLLLRAEARGDDYTPGETGRRKPGEGGGEKENKLLANREKKGGGVSAPAGVWCHTSKRS